MTPSRSTPRDWAQTYIEEKACIRGAYDAAATLLAKGLLREISDLAPSATDDDLVQLLESTRGASPSHYWMPPLEQSLIDEAKKILDFYSDNFGVDFSGDVSATSQNDKTRSMMVDVLHIRLPWYTVQSIFEKHLGVARPILLVADFCVSSRRLLNAYVDGIEAYDLRDLRVLKRTFDEFWDNSGTWLKLRNGLDG